MNVFSFCSIVFSLLYIVWFFYNYVPIKDNRYLEDARLMSIVVGITLYDIFNFKEFFDDPETIKNGFFIREHPDDTLGFYVVFLKDYFREYIQSKESLLKELKLPIEEYLYLYYCTFSNIFAGVYNDVIAQSIQKYDFKAPSKCNLFCNQSRSSFPCNFNHVSQEYDYEIISFKALGAANTFLNYKRIFPLPDIDKTEITERWNSMLDEGKEFFKKDIDAIEKCIMINIDFYTRCNLNPLIYSFF